MRKGKDNDLITRDSPIGRCGAKDEDEDQSTRQQSFRPSTLNFPPSRSKYIVMSLHDNCGVADLLSRIGSQNSENPYSNRLSHINY